MIKRFFFFISALVFLCGSTSIKFASNGLPTHTQYTPELEPISFDNSYPRGAFQTASVCFLGSGVGCGDGKFGKGDDYSLDSVKQCQDANYNITSCTLPTYLTDKCPYNDKYYAKCVTDTAQACKDSGYNVTSCGTGYVVESTCPYNSSYKKCKCNPCDGYTYTYAQATAQGYVADGSCQSCSTTKYKRKNNPCSGYTTCECGGATNAKTCYTGSTLKYNSCKACCENRCTLAKCPDNHTCDYEACSNKYCDNGCAAGYTDMCLTGDTCVGMGYSQQSCIGDTLYCPYNTSYRFCLSL